MQCPYCLSEVSKDAFVCKACARDIYMFKELLVKIDELEAVIKNQLDPAADTDRIATLETIVDEPVRKVGFLRCISDIALFIVLPLALLLIAHALITVVYDTKMVYLRIISMTLPFVFGYFLFRSVRRALFPWFVGVLFLAIASVIGMSGMTSLVDGAPIWPESLFEWREVLEYSTSIAFSFLTGMLLGHVTYISTHQRRSGASNPLMTLLLTKMSQGTLSPDALHTLIKKINEYGTTIVALATTGITIYTGLKHVL